MKSITQPHSDTTTTKLSIVIPVYNERDGWRELLRRVQAVDLRGIVRQFILVDDGSSDGTREQLKLFADEKERLESTGSDGADEFKVIFHSQNQGKGAALRTGFQAADGDVVIIQDADLEYDPNDYPRLLSPLLSGSADVVYGSRFLEVKGRKGYLKNYLANKFLTILSNFSTGLKLTDMETCYKVFRREVLQKVTLEQNRFGFEPEITSEIARLGVTVLEVPISYDARGHQEGKKIGWRDGLKAIWCIFKYGRLFRFARRRGKEVR